MLPHYVHDMQYKAFTNWIWQFVSSSCLTIFIADLKIRPELTEDSMSHLSRSKSYDPSASLPWYWGGRDDRLNPAWGDGDWFVIVWLRHDRFPSSHWALHQRHTNGVADAEKINKKIELNEH